MFSFIVVNGFLYQKKGSNQFNSLTSPAHQMAVFFISVVITKQFKISFQADSSLF